MLASLFLQELKDALDSQVFPPEICCASICYFIYISPRQSNAEYVSITTECIMFVEYLILYKVLLISVL